MLIKGGRKEKEGEIASLENKRRKRKRRDNIETINFSFSFLSYIRGNGRRGEGGLGFRRHVTLAATTAALSLLFSVGGRKKEEEEPESIRVISPRMH